MTERWCFAVCQPEEDRGAWTWWKMTFEKKKKKREAAGEEEAAQKASGSSAEARTTLLSADYCLSWGNLRVWGGTLVAFSACFNKARTEWDRSLSLALEMLGHKQQEKDWSCCRCACDTRTPSETEMSHLTDALQFPLTVTLQTVVLTCTPTNEPPHSSRARPDCCGWRYVVESSITKGSLRSNQVCPNVSGVQCQPSKDRPWLAGGHEGTPGLFTTSGGKSITRIRTRLRLPKANWDTASTGDRFLCSPVHPAAKWETAGGMERTLFKPTSVLCKLLLWKKLAFCLNIGEGRVMALDDKSDLGLLWKLRKMFRLRRQSHVPGPWN